MKTRTTGIIIGAVAGALLGLLVAWILLEKEGPSAEVGAQRRPMRPNDVIALILSAVGLVRQVAVLRQR